MDEYNNYATNKRLTESTSTEDPARLTRARDTVEWFAGTYLDSLWVGLEIVDFLGIDWGHNDGN